ncbi:HEAT repeat domain-containing protein [Candidatus Uabimicrobium sp. HlEnr_7]|uniref:HEAT repeat domain-containing protein n=1 Tax=Candidatus Uabimicrobium helgolandensis TaxID=3095367 RepID=UPI003557F097
MDREYLEKLQTAKYIDSAVIPDLVKLLGDSELRYNAAIALGHALNYQPNGIQLVREALAYSRIEIQYYLILAIRYMEDNILALVPDLISFLDSKSDRIREIAANTLGETKDTRSTFKLLELMCSDPSENVRYYAMHALGDIKDTETIKPLISLISQQNGETCMYAIHVLGKMHTEAKEAIPFIFPYLQDENEKMVAIAATALGNMGDQRALIILEKIAKSTSPSFMLSAKKALQNLKSRIL